MSTGASQRSALGMGDKEDEDGAAVVVHHPRTSGFDPTDADASIGHPLWPVLTSMFLHWLCVGLAIPFYSHVLFTSPYAMGDIIEGEEVSDAEKVARAQRTQMVLSVCSMMNSALELVSSGLLGVLCDRIGRWPVAVLTQIGQFTDFTTAMLCTPMLANQHFLIRDSGMAMLMARSFAGVCGNMKVPMQAAIADLSTEETAADNFGKAGACVGLAMIAGPLIATTVLHTIGELRFVLMCASSVSLLNIVVVSTCWPPAKQRARGQRSSWKEANPVFLITSTLGRSPTLAMYGGMNFLDAFSLSMFLVAMPMFTKERFGWGPRQLGPFFLAFGVLMPLQVGVLLPFLRRCIGEVRVLMMGYFFSCLAFFLFFVAGLAREGVFFMMVLFPFTLGFISNPTQTVMANREVTSDLLGRLSGAYSVVETIGKTFAPMVAATLLNRTIDGPWPSFVFLAASVVLFPGLLMALRVSRLMARGRAAAPLETEMTDPVAAA